MKANLLIGVAGLMLLLAPAIGGAQSIYSTSGASVTCNTVIGTGVVKPALGSGLPNAPTTLKLKALLTGCVVSGADPALVVTSGTLSAVFTAAAPGLSCGALGSGASVSGNFVIKWKAGKGQKLDFPTTTVAPTGGTLGGGLLVIGTGTYGNFTATGSLVGTSNAFAAGVPSFSGVTAEDIGNLFGQCNTPPAGTSKGLKLIHLGVGQVTM